MKYVRTPEEVKEMLKAFKPTFPEARGIAAIVETSPEFVREVLPPPLTPADMPLVSIMMINSKLFNIMAVLVRCRYGNFEGDYGLGYVLDSDHPIIYGRELWGEPKKLGDITLTRNGDQIVGAVTRKGVEVVRLEARALQPADPNLFASADHLHFKYSIKADATGIEDARLVHIHFDNNVRSVEACEGQVRFQHSPHDIYGDIPVKNIAAMVYFDADMSATGKYLANVDAEKLLPYAFFKHDDYRLLGF